MGAIGGGGGGGGQVPVAPVDFKQWQCRMPLSPISALVTDGILNSVTWDMTIGPIS